MNLAKVSIITVTYNAAQELESTIKSVINQTYINKEYIIIDGASTDGTVQTIKKYESSINKWISEPDSGLYHAMNKGISYATGDYLWFINAGDIIPTNTVLQQIMELADNRDFLYGNAVKINKQGQERQWYKKQPLETEISYKSFINGMVICHQAMMVKRILAENYEWDSWKIVCDLEWTIRTLKRCKTFKATNLLWCKFQDGGVSDKKRKQALVERFKLSFRYFGIWPTLIQHIKIVIAAIRRGSIS